MRTFDYICMAIAFFFAALSAMVFWEQGFHAWIWQVISMIWIFNCFMKQRTIDKMEKESK